MTTYHALKSIGNPHIDDLIVSSPYLRLQQAAHIVDCEVKGGHMLGKGTCWSGCRLGCYVAMGSWSFMSATSVGNYCTFGSRVSIGAFSHPLNWVSIHEFQYRDTKDIYGDSIIPRGVNNLKGRNEYLTQIGNDVWIGDNAVVLRGVNVRTGSVIGAGAVVTSDTDEFSIMVGNPARKVRKRFDDLTIAKLLESTWWEYPIGFFEDLEFSDVERFLLDFNKRRMSQSTPG
jgi:virginiamycin A acetyltransferase